MRSRSYNRYKQFESRSNRSGVAQLDDMLTLGDGNGLEASARGGALRMNEFNVLNVQKDVAISGKSVPAKPETTSLVNFTGNVKAA